MALQDTLQQFSDQVGDLFSTGVVHREEGTAIATLSKDEVDEQASDAYLAEMLRIHDRAQEGLGTESSTEDLVLSTSHGNLFARPLGESEYLWTVSTGTRANIALTRALMRKYQEQVLEDLP